MKGESREEQFDEAEELFTGEDDQNIIKSQRSIYAEASQLSQFTDSPAGKILIKSLKDEITKAMSLLIETRKGRYISDIESNLNLLSKLINSKNLVSTIGKWLDSLE